MARGRHIAAKSSDDRDREPSADSKIPSVPRRRRRTKFFGWGAGLLFLLAALVFVAPWLLSVASIRQAVVKYTTSQIDGQVSVGSASLSWWAPVVLGDVTLDSRGKDGEDGEPLLRVASIRTEKSLFSLLMSPREIGVLRIEQPQMYLTLSRDTSNWEEALAEYLADDEDSGTAAVRCTIEVIDGHLDWTDSTSDRKGAFDALQANLVFGDLVTEPLTAKIHGESIGPGDRPGDLQAEISWQAGEQPEDPVGQGSAAITTARVPLDVLGPVLRRFAGDVQIRGTVDTDLRCEWNGSERAKVDIASLVAENVELAGPGWARTELIRSARTEAHGGLDLDRGNVRLRELRVDSDFAQFDGDGQIPLARLWQQNSVRGAADALRGEECAIRGTVDLARLARMLPATLRVRPGTEIRSGEVEYHVRGGPDGKRQRWTAGLVAKNLAGSEGGRSIAVQQPIELALVALDTPDGPRVEELTCKSSFLQASAKGSLDKGSATLRGDMRQFVAQLSQFMDLGSVKADGALEADVDWALGAENLVRAEGKLLAERFQLVAPNQLPWHEDHLTMTFSLDADCGGGSVRSLERGELSLKSGNDQLDAELTGPVDLAAVDPAGTNAAWPLKVQASGELATWLARAQPVFRPAGWQLAGTAQLQASGRFSPQLVELAQSKLEVRQLQALGPGVHVREPKVIVEASGSWDATAHRFASKSTTFASSALAFRAGNVLVQVDRSEVALAGDIGFRSDLSRLVDWVRDPQTATMRYAGTAAGEIKLTHRGDLSTAQLSATVENPSVAQSDGAGGWQTLWQDQTAQISGDGTYSNGDDTIAIRKLELDSDKSLRVAAAGSIAEPAGNCRVDLEGQVSYDLALIVEKLRSYFGDTLQISGKDTRSFAVRGPLWPERSLETPDRTDSTHFTAAPHKRGPLVHPDLAAASSMTWQRVNFQGLVAGAGELSSNLEQGILNINPLDLAVSEGRLTMSPRIELNAGPPMLVLEQGPLVQNVRISPEICQAWLKYLAPLLADVTEVEGRFSVDLDRALIPLDHPKTGTVQGQLAIHKARVGPSPLSQQFLWIAKQVKAIAEGDALNLAAPAAADWVELPEHQVDFQMVEGRVHHRQLRFQVRDVAIETSGSVGFDQTISLVAQVPIQDKWVDRNRMLSSLRGQVLQIPIGGSLTRPKVDERTLREVSAQALRGAAGRVLEDELNKGLKRLFGEPK